MGARHRGREAALRILYQADINEEGIEVVIAAQLAPGALVEPGDEPLDEAALRFAERLARGVANSRSRLDALLAAGSSNWRVERMAAVDRNVLRLALYELFEHPGEPAAVILDEAVELAKLYGGQESGSFVNGVADGIRRRLASGELTREPLS